MYLSNHNYTAQELNVMNNQISNVVFRVNKTGEITNWNKGAERLFGYSASEIIGDSFTKIIPNTDQNKTVSTKRFLYNNKQKNQKSTLALRKNGEFVPFAYSIHPLQGDIFCILGQEESEIKKTAIEMASYKYVLDKISIIAEVNLQGAILSTNDNFFRHLGYEDSEIVGKNIDMIWQKNEVNTIGFKDIINLVKSISMWKCEVQMIRKNHSKKWFDLSVTPIFDENQKVTKFIVVKQLVAGK